MNAECLLRHYERIADAPDAIARLRRFILDLAVHGKLVPPDPNDEPASKLLERIATEKARLVTAGEIRKAKPLRTVDEDADFDVPATWLWTRLGIVTSYIQRGKSPKYAASGGSPVVSQRCVQWGGLDLTVAKQITLESLAHYEDIRFLRDGDLLWNSTGTGTIGRVIRLVDPPEKLVCDSHVTVVRCLEVDPEYIRIWLRSNHVYALTEDRAVGSTNQVELTAQMAINQVVPLPPLAEQHRIVAKVDELMVLCDRLEAARTEREATRDRLAAASLARLNVPDPETFQADTRFALDALPALTTRPDQIKQLRQTILNLAVRGKLVPQDPKDEPASELLKKQFELPNRYLRRRKIIKEASVDASDGVLASIPETWAYARIQNLYDANIVIDYADGNHGSLYPRNSEFGEEGVTFVSAKDLVDGRVVWETCSKLNRDRAGQLTKGWAQTGDVLLTHNATVGRVAKVPEQVEPFLLGTSVTFYRLNEHALHSDYFFVVLQSPVWQRQLEAIMAQTTRNQVSIQKQAFFTIPIPPLAEQHRIVAKVGELMALCERLEASLSRGDGTRRRLLDAFLHEALEPANAALQAAE